MYGENPHSFKLRTSMPRFPLELTREHAQNYSKILTPESGLGNLRRHGSRPSQWPEHFLAGAANGARPIIGQVFKAGAFGDLPFSIPSIRVVNVAAVYGLTLPHLFRFRHLSPSFPDCHPGPTPKSRPTDLDAIRSLAKTAPFIVVPLVPENNCQDKANVSMSRSTFRGYSPSL